MSAKNEHSISANLTPLISASPAIPTIFIWNYIPKELVLHAAIIYKNYLILRPLVMKALKLFTLIGVAYCANSLHAGESLTPHNHSQLTSKGYAWIQPSDKDLLINIPSLKLSDIKDQMHKTRSDLTVRKNKLTLTVKEKEFSFGDGLITLILPGGVLYAATVKRNYIRAKNELIEVTSRLKEITHDISSFTTQAQAPKAILIARN